MALMIGFARRMPLDEPYFLSYVDTFGIDSALYRINPDGTGQALMTDLTPKSSWVRWSPKSMQVAVEGVAPRQLYARLRVLHWDGRAGRVLTDFPIFPVYIDWQSDASHLIVEVDDYTAYAMMLYRVPLDSGEPELVREGEGRAARLSPDGVQYAFNRMNDGYVNLSLMKSDGSAERPLNDETLTDFVIGWSPDGERILFSHAFDGTSGVLYDIRPDGGGMRPLMSIADRRRLEAAAYSPDGRWIAVTSIHNGQHELAVIPADGGDVRSLITAPNYDLSPAWSPDSAWIAFHLQENGRSAVWRIRPDGSDLQHLVNGVGSISLLAWSPPYALDWQPGVALLGALAVLAALAAAPLRMPPVIGASPASRTPAR